jgi:hypothetical protein
MCCLIRFLARYRAAPQVNAEPGPAHAAGIETVAVEPDLNRNPPRYYHEEAMRLAILAALRAQQWRHAPAPSAK